MAIQLLHAWTACLLGVAGKQVLDQLLRTSGFADDFLTSVTLYPFGAAGIPHLVISRPSTSGIDVLTRLARRG